MNILELLEGDYVENVDGKAVMKAKRFYELCLNECQSVMLCYVLYECYMNLMFLLNDISQKL